MSIIKIIELPREITYIGYAIFKGFNNIIQLDYLIQKFNNAKDEAVKIVKEYGGYKELVKKVTQEVNTKAGKRIFKITEIRKYEDYKLIDNKVLAGYLYQHIYNELPNMKYSTTVFFEVLNAFKSINVLRDKLKLIGKYKLANELPSDLEIEFNYWNFISCIGTKEKGRKGNRNIKVNPNGEVRINNPFGRDITGFVKFEGRFGRIFKQIYNDLISIDQLQYYARVVRIFENYNSEYVRCAIHVIIPFDIHVQYDCGKIVYPDVTQLLMSGQDVNADRVNSVIVNRKDLQIVNIRTFWFDEANQKGVDSDYVWWRIEKELHELFRWLKKNKCFLSIWEDYELMGMWRFIIQLKGEKLRSSEGNWRKFTFRSSIIEKAGVVAVREYYPLPILHNPAGIDKLAKETCSYFGLDEHMMEAYYIATLWHLEQEINDKNHL